MTKRAAKKIASGLQDALAYAKIDALWKRTKKEQGEEITQYDWGYRDGLFAARALFGKTASKGALDRSGVIDALKQNANIDLIQRDRIEEITKRFAPRTTANNDTPKGKTVNDLHKEWMEDPEYRKAIKKSKPITKRKPKKK